MTPHLLAFATSLTLATGLLTACASPTVASDHEKAYLIEKRQLSSALAFDGQAVRAEIAEHHIALHPAGRALSTGGGSARPDGAASLTVVRHVDVVRYYNGGDPSCTTLNDTDRPWEVREFLWVDGSELADEDGEKRLRARDESQEHELVFELAACR